MIIQTLLLIGFGLPLAKTDLAEHRLPNRLVAALTVSELVLSALFAAYVETYRSTFVFSLVLAVVIAVVAIAASLLTPVLIGMGDAKLLFVISFLTIGVGPLGLIAGLFWVGIAGCSFGLYAITLGNKNLKSALPFGPILLSAPLASAAMQPFLLGLINSAVTVS